jgi:hypothetical protein
MPTCQTSLACKAAPGKSTCENCGQDVPLDSVGAITCEAEATLDEIEKMQSGEVPPRAIMITPWQSRQLSERRGPSEAMSRQEIERLFGRQPDKLLIGSRLKLLFDSIGFPPCSGCSARAVYMDEAHEWLLSVFGIQV